MKLGTLTIFLKTKANNFILLFLFKSLLDLVYFFYYHERVMQFKVANYLISTFLLLLISLYISNKNKFSSFFLWLILVSSFIPMLTIFSFSDKESPILYVLYAFIFWIIALSYEYLPFKFPVFPGVPDFKYIFIFSSVIGVYVLLSALYNFGLNFNFDLNKVYSIREKFVTNNIPFSGYVYNWYSNIIAPFLFVLTVLNRKWVFTVILVIIQFYLFSISGYKTFLFIIPFVFLLTLIINKGYKLIPVFFSSLMIISIGALLLFKNGILYGYFIRRNLIGPAELSYNYYDFFSKSAKVFLSDGIFKRFFEYPYELNPPRLIGSIYYKQFEGASANSGLYADAYMNFGFAGIIIWGLLFMLLFKFIDDISKGLDQKILISLWAMPSVALINTSFFTCFLTHGMIISILIMYFYPKKSAAEKNRRLPEK